MRHTTFHRNNRMRLQKIKKKLAREAKLVKKQGKARAAQAKPA